MSNALSIKNEMLRKSIHICNSLFAYSLFIFDQRNFAIFIGALTIIIILFEILRIKNSNLNRLFIRFFGRVTRDFEKSKLTGATYVMIPSFILVFFFDIYICIASILIMSYSDTAAAIIGKKYGSIEIFNKTLEGSLAFFIVGLFIIVIIYPNISLFYSFIALIVATIVEVLPIKIDDNLSVPLVAALIMSLG